MVDICYGDVSYESARYTTNLIQIFKLLTTETHKNGEREMYYRFMRVFDNMSQKNIANIVSPYTWRNSCQRCYKSHVLHPDHDGYLRNRAPDRSAHVDHPECRSAFVKFLDAVFSDELDAVNRKIQPDKVNYWTSDTEFDPPFGVGRHFCEYSQEYVDAMVADYPIIETPKTDFPRNFSQYVNITDSNWIRDNYDAYNR
jgi:hypothetical protein